MEITFLGAAEEVTGSCYLLKTAQATVLLECGQIQGRRSDEERNQIPKSIDIQHLDAVILSHAHIDHSGRLPLLVKNGYQGPIYTHQASRALCEIMLLDSGYLHEKDAEWENKRRKEKGKPLVEPLFTQEDAKQTLPLFVGIDYKEKTEVAKNLFVRFNDAGHILGAAIVEIWDESQKPAKKLVFSGDLGFGNAPVMRDPEKISQADLVMMESTYGDRPHKHGQDTMQELGEIFKEAHAMHGNILIPAFAVGRTQDLLYLMAQNFSDWNLGDWRIFLDSPMAIRATEVYGRFRYLYDAKLFNRDGDEPVLPNLEMTMSTEESEAINYIHSGAIVIAGSGMCTGGRIHHHLKHNISKPNAHLVFVGYQAYGTLGRMIVDGVKDIKLWGKKYEVRAQVHTIGGLSAHADQDGLVDWYSGFENQPPLYLVHGEPKAQTGLQERLRNEMAVTAHIPKFGDKVKV
jgi:metallo-beta-lactamase family protein